ncbi:MAG: hypothetical protein Q8K32_31420 [Archangium sp.]|nr:hypothetical protein [Archangium sp.]
MGVAQNSERARAPSLEISDELIEQASKLIAETGATRRAAARKCNVSENTFKGWLREAADLKDDNDPRRRLLHAVESAEGEAEFMLTQAYWAGAQVDAQVAQRFLERRFSKGDEKWARTEHLTVSDGDAAPMEMADARKLLADKLSKLLGGAGAGGGDSGRAGGGVASRSPEGTATEPAGATPERAP